jgi:D-glycero-alpha-D-manno-heptose-7-phosphate kinase
MTTTARAWCRVDLAGGTLDIWPLGLLHPGAATVNVSIDLPATVELTLVDHGWAVFQEGEEHRCEQRRELLERPETSLVGVVAEALDLPPVEIRLASASPRGGGLGASSALAVALLAAADAALGHPVASPYDRAGVARDLEARLMSLPTGTQDHFGAQVGGVLEIRYPPGGVAVRRMEGVDLDALGNCLLVAYTGQSHFSAGSNWQVVRRRLDGEAEVSRHFEGIAAAADRVAEALRAGDLPAVGRAVSDEWSHRRQLAEGVSTPKIEKMLRAAVDAGAWGGKACGAGGGGCLAVLCPPSARSAVGASLERLGGLLIPARPTTEPLAVDGRPIVDPAQL